jgi:hypothetical protein
MILVRKQWEVWIWTTEKPSLHINSEGSFQQIIIVDYKLTFVL